MALNRDKYDIEVRDDYEIKRNQIFFVFMQGTFSCMDGLYIHEECVLIDTIKKYQFRKQSAADIEGLKREKNDRNKRRKEHISLLQKRAVF